MDKPKVLILCTGNSCRSHMAEAILRAADGDLFGGFRRIRDDIKRVFEAYAFGYREAVNAACASSPC